MPDLTGFVDIGPVASPVDADHNCAFKLTIKDNGRGDSDSRLGFVSDPFVLAITGTTRAPTTRATTTRAPTTRATTTRAPTTRVTTRRATTTRQNAPRVVVLVSSSGAVVTRFSGFTPSLAIPGVQGLVGAAFDAIVTSSPSAFLVLYPCVAANAFYFSVNGGASYLPFPTIGDSGASFLGPVGPNGECVALVSVVDNGRGDGNALKNALTVLIVIAMDSNPTTVAPVTTTKPVAPPIVISNTTDVIITGFNVQAVTIPAPPGTTFTSLLVSFNATFSRIANLTFLPNFPNVLVSVNVLYKCGTANTVFKTFNATSFYEYVPMPDLTGFVDIGPVASPVDAEHNCAFKLTIKDNGRGDSDSRPGFVSDPFVLAITGTPGSGDLPDSY